MFLFLFRTLSLCNVVVNLAYILPLFENKEMRWKVNKLQDSELKFKWSEAVKMSFLCDNTRGQITIITIASSVACGP